MHRQGRDVSHETWGTLPTTIRLQFYEAKVKSHFPPLTRRDVPGGASPGRPSLTNSPLFNTDRHYAFVRQVFRGNYRRFQAPNLDYRLSNHGLLVFELLLEGGTA